MSNYTTNYAPCVQQPLAAFAFTYFACAVVGLASINFIVTSVIDRATLVRPRRSRTGLVVRFIAIFRWLAYPSPRFLGTYEYYDPAAAALIVAFSIYALVWVLIASEYDTEQCLQSVSPALSVRAGWFSLSTTPFIFALATKKNPISFITGMSYHDLSIYHRWLSRILLAIVLIHGIPIFARAGQQHVLAEQWATDRVWWTGVAAFLILLWLVISSFSPVRRWNYEFFVVQHIISGIAYLAFLFLHTRDLFTSWLWLWATVGIYAASVALRVIGQARWSTGLSKATVQVLVDNALAVYVERPTKRRWRAGAHVFIRFVELSPYQSHPFVIASIPDDGQLVFIISKKNGITRRLYNKAEERKDMEWKTRVLIDGPYGGPLRDPAAFDTVVLFSGGVGAMFTFPIMSDIIFRMQNEGKVHCNNIVFVWTIRSENQMKWLKNEILRCASANETSVYVAVYVTDPKLLYGDVDILAPNVTVHYQRPKLGKILVERNQGSMYVIGCGPAPLIATASNETARLQKEVIAGNASGEICLYMETFGW